MKKYRYLIIFVMMIFMNISCEDYLETSSNSTFTEESAFTNLDFATKNVYGIYNILASSYTTGFYLIFFNYDTDIECKFTVNSGIDALSHYAGDENNIYLKTIWNYFYQAIERANICIDNLPISSIWEGEYADEAKRLYGEAVTLRAWFFFQLVSTWGDVPFPIRSTQAGDDLYLPKTDRDSIYEYLIQDLKDVEDYVPWMNETLTTERISKVFVKGLRAKMALSYAGYSLRNVTFETRRGRYWEEYYEIANQECKEIMESGKHQLNPDFENIFKTLHTYSQDLTYKESLFEVAYGRLYSGQFAYGIGMPFYKDDSKYGKASGSVRVPPNYYYSFDSKDSRRNTSVELYYYNNKSTISKQSLLGNGLQFTPSKWRKSWIDPSMGGSLMSAYFTGINFPLMRYSDIILMFAESENEINGPTQLAKDALSLIRQRAFSEEDWALKVTAYVDSVATDKDAFFNAIVDERAWEFGGELRRKKDLVRWNLLGPKIREMKEECLKIYNDDPEYSNVPTYIFWKRNEDNDELIEILNPDYRLPSTAIDGYSRTSWLPTRTASQIAKRYEQIDRVANGYDETKNNHLYPIYDEFIVASNGVLSNDQIP